MIEQLNGRNLDEVRNYDLFKLLVVVILLVNVLVMFVGHAPVFGGANASRTVGATHDVEPPAPDPPTSKP